MINKKRETEELFNKLLAYVDAKGCMLYVPYDSLRDVAQATVNLGYGNVKKAIKEFAQAGKDCLLNTTIGHTQEFNDGYNTALIYVKNIIDNLIIELYGADE